ncbi:MAG: hypothetical protein ACAI34_03800 [Verrucomicrobium sp.]|nr:hypothetical protein [Verrucomicrobium sp.]
MKYLLTYTGCLLIAMDLNAGEPAAKGNVHYNVSPNKGLEHFPTQLPIFNDQDPKQFNWDKYVSEATSEADRVFRGYLAYQQGIDTIRQLQIFGADDSTGGTATRYSLGWKEIMTKCERIEKLYREKLKTSPAILEILERFISASRTAMDANVEVIASSWSGGSGGKAVNAEVRYRASLRYLDGLRSLTASLDLQDLPEVLR